MIQEISINNFLVSAFHQWDSSWFLLSCGDLAKNDFNCMTVAWGGFGNMWNLPITMVVVRPTRYTYTFINHYQDFTLCAFPEKYRSALNILGSQSGRDGDKLSLSGLTTQPAAQVSAPSFVEAELCVECRKLYWQDFLPENFLDARIEQKYPAKDYHRMFFGEIVALKGDAMKFSREKSKYFQ